MAVDSIPDGSVIKEMTEEQWLAIKNCDENYDGIFFYALKSTKTVCRPSCKARTPNPKNVKIFYTLEDALNHGFRPCNRCRPDCMDWHGAKNELAQKAKEYIDSHYADKFSLRVIAGNLYVDPYYMHRAFKQVTGMTLLQYQHKVRIKKAMSLLAKTGLSASFIACEVGYGTLSHFSRVFKKVMGISPSEYRSSHKNSQDEDVPGISGLPEDL